MKKFTKLLGIVLIIALVMSMGTMALAEDTYSNTTINVTVNGNQQHGYSAIQIFTGTQVIDGNDNNPLGDIQWGNYGSDTLNGMSRARTRIAIINAVNEILGKTAADDGYVTPSGDTPAAPVAEAISTMDTEKANLLARKLYQILRKDTMTGMGCFPLYEGSNKVPIGYYLVFDQNIGGSSYTENLYSDAANAALLQMTHDITVTAKTDAPVFEKKVYENSSKYNLDVSVSDYLQDRTGNRTYGEGFNDVADYNIGDVVTFKLYSKIPDMTYFDKYKFVFRDGMTPGLSLMYDENGLPDIKVEIGTKAGGTIELTQGTDWQFATTTIAASEQMGGNPMGLGYVGDAFNIDLQSTDRQDSNTSGLRYLVEKYMADITGNADSTFAEAANYPITVTIKAKLNEKARVESVTWGDYGHPNINCAKLIYSCRPEYPDDTWETRVDGVVIYTYELDIWKLDGTPADLPEPYASSNEQMVSIYDGESSQWKYYIKIDGKWYPNTILDGAQFCLKATSGTHAGKYVTVDEELNRVSGWLDSKPAVSSDTPNIAKTKGVFISTAGNNLIKILGLDDGEYELEELKAPAGYNSLTEPVTIKLQAGTNNGHELAPGAQAFNYSDGGWNGKITLTVDGSTETFPGSYRIGYTNASTPGLAIAKIVNNSGTVLPSTGGIGTTIFYVIGSILVVAAGVLLITKKRMSREG